MSEANTTVLVADDDSTIRRNLVRLLQSEGYRTIEAADGDEALAGVQANNPDAVLLDLKMPGRDGLKVLAELQPLLADLPVIVITALGGSAAAIEAMRRGAYDYLSKPFDLDEVLLTLKRALRQRALAIEVKALRARTKQNAGETQDGYDDEPELIGRSAAMLEVFKSIGLAAAMDAPVLIVGESGTGKELVAAALHRHSSRTAGPLIRVNCGALPDGLVESELFGHEKGAFTGADRQKPGRFERAAGGTLFLDEVGELPLSAQTKILRVLQQREFERVGGTETLRTDARVISATHRDLSREVAAGRFREDLFYRLNVARIVILPLRERPEDIGPLAEYILRRLEQRHGWRELSLSPQALQSIRERPWPGNVRQLENALARAAIAARGRAILPEHLDADDPAQVDFPVAEVPNEPLPLRALLADVERRRSRVPCWPAAATAPGPPNALASAVASSSTRSASTTLWSLRPDARSLQRGAVVTRRSTIPSIGSSATCLVCLTVVVALGREYVQGIGDEETTTGIPDARPVGSPGSSFSPSTRVQPTGSDRSLRAGRPGWSPTQAPHRSGLAHHAPPGSSLMTSLRCATGCGPLVVWVSRSVAPVEGSPTRGSRHRGGAARASVARSFSLPPGIPGDWGSYR